MKYRLPLAALKHGKHNCQCDTVTPCRPVLFGVVDIARRLKAQPRAQPIKPLLITTADNAGHLLSDRTYGYRIQD